MSNAHNINSMPNQKLLLSIDQIWIGEPVEYDCYSSTGMLLLKKGFTISSKQTLERLIENGLYAAIEETEIPHNDVPTSPFQYFDELKSHLSSVFTEARKESSGIGFTEQVETVAYYVQKMCLFDANAAIGLVHLDRNDRYIIFHPLHRSILCELVGKRYGFAEEVRKRIICAALTCDLSIINLQQELAEQKSPLTPVQQKHIQNHPTESVNLLRKLGVADEEWLTSVSQHHETLGGTGYPGKIPKTEFMMWSKLISLADSYTAMITPNPYRKNNSSKDAMRFILMKRDQIFDPQLTIMLVKELGVYPPGTFVKLVNCETAIVVSRTENSTAPMVKTVVGSRGAPLGNPLLRNTQSAGFRIHDILLGEDVVNGQDVITDPYKLWDYSKP